MKNLLIAFIAFISFSSDLKASIAILSDLDDTIKITNSDDPAEATRNATLSDDVFIGMPEFLRAAKAYAPKLHLLSASPKILQPKIRLNMKVKGIKVDSITLKNPLDGQTTRNYKINAVKKIFETHSEDDFILIGDDVQHDGEVYDVIRKLYPNRVLAIYIHVVKNRPVPASAVKWWTSYDLFLQEHLAKRMPDSDVYMAGDHLIGDARLNHIIPKFADCPKTPDVWLWQLKTWFAKDALILSTKLNAYCSATRQAL